jgi:hypothetical protein
MLANRILRKREVVERLGIRKAAFYESFIKVGRPRFVKICARPWGCYLELDANWDNPERLKVAEADHETDIEKWFDDRHRSKKSVPEATVVGPFT